MTITIVLSSSTPRRRLTYFSKPMPPENRYKRLKSDLLTSMEVKYTCGFLDTQIMSDLGCFKYSSSSAEASVDFSHTDRFVPTTRAPSAPQHKSPVLTDLESFLPLSVSTTSSALIISRSQAKFKTIKPRLLKLVNVEHKPFSPIKLFLMKGFQKIKEMNTKDLGSPTSPVDTFEPIRYKNPMKGDGLTNYKLSAVGEEKMAIDLFLDLEDNSEIKGALLYYLQESTSTIQVTNVSGEI